MVGAYAWIAVIWSKRQRLEPDMEQQSGSKLGKEYIKPVYCHFAYLTSMQNTSQEMLAGWSISWNQDCGEKFQWPQICRWHYPCGRMPGGSAWKESACNVGDLGSIPELGRSPGEGHGNPLQYSCLKNPHGQRNLAGYSPWGHKESDMLTN